VTPAATETKTSAAAERNKEPIAQQLRLLLPDNAAVLEIASGTGQHVAHFAAAMPASRWQPTDSNPDNLPLIQARIEGLSTAHVSAPLLLDVHQADWGLDPQFDAVLAAGSPPTEAPTLEALRFVAERRGSVAVLEEAKAAGHLVERPIHGDPKVNNVLMDRGGTQAVALIDLDTVKPGLVHYDIGDALRSGCNPLGEEPPDLTAVCFDLDLARAMLEGYLGAARGFLTPADLEHLFAAIRLLPLELGLRFLTDHLAGDHYFKTSYPGQNLHRARVQFQLTRSIEDQEQGIRAIIQALT
jgi:hypothetical protein